MTDDEKTAIAWALMDQKLALYRAAFDQLVLEGGAHAGMIAAHLSLGIRVDGDEEFADIAMRIGAIVASNWIMERVDGATNDR